MTADLATHHRHRRADGLLIGGQWTTGRAGMLPVIDPATEEPIAEVANATAEDALDAVSAAARGPAGLGRDPAARAGRVPAPRLRADDRSGPSRWPG